MKINIHFHHQIPLNPTHWTFYFFFYLFSKLINVKSRLTDMSNIECFTSLFQVQLLITLILKSQRCLSPLD